MSDTVIETIVLSPEAWDELKRMCDGPVVIPPGLAAAAKRYRDDAVAGRLVSHMTDGSQA